MERDATEALEASLAARLGVLNLGYLALADFYRGDPVARRTERAEKLDRARASRRRLNEELLKAAA